MSGSEEHLSDDERESGLSEGNGAALTEFMHRIFHYERLPTQWELSQLAAMVGSEVPEDHSYQSVNEAKRRVALAMWIWQAAGERLLKETERRAPAEKGFEERHLLYGPLKVGKHFLPAVTDAEIGYESAGEEPKPIVPLARIEEIIIGLSKPEQRRPWWRAYLTAKIKAYRGVSDDTPLEDGLLESVITRQRENGIRPGFQAQQYLEGFRLWRLTMGNEPGKKAKTPYDLQTCAKKGLEAVRKLNS